MQNNNVILKPNDFKKISSPYLSGGKKEDIWEILEITINDKKLTAKARMISFYKSSTDKNKFHMSTITGLEIVGQLRIIFLHVYLGLEEKTREVWFLRGSERCLHSIRDPENIFIEMECNIESTESDKHMVAMHANISDPQGGNFVFTAKVLMS
jgi:hypothetical protein